MFRGMKKIHKIFVSAAGAVLSAAMMLMTLGGCADILNLTPTNTVASANVWQDASLARSAVLGVYNEFYARYSYGGGDWWGETFETYSSVMDNDKNWRENVTVCYGSATPSSGTFSNMYKYYYTFVFRANDVISHIDQVPDMDAEEKARLKAEAKFLRGYAYMVLNILWRGVPLYLEYLDNPGDANRPRSSEEQVWNAVITDFTDCINEPSLPDKYPAGSNDYGRVTKGAAYAFRGQAYQFLAAAADNPDEYLKTALSDFEKIEKLGYSLYQGAGDNSYSELFKPANEQCDEIIFSIQCTVQNGMGNPRAILYGSRVTGGSAWNNYLPNPAFVESFENADGSVFDWEDYFPEWNSMTPQQRSVFFLRDGMTEDEKTRMEAYGADMTKYLDLGNEARILAAYSARDPRLAMSVITPYATYVGSSAGLEHTYTLRWPYRGSDTAEPFDIRTDTNDKFYYLWRKYVPEGLECTTRWVYEEDILLCRYAEILLRRAECLNELGRTDEAVDLVNKVRARAGHVLLDDPQHPATAVEGQEDMRERIRNEFYWELGGEDSMYFNELRWGNWIERKFYDRSSGQTSSAVNTNGLMQIWGETTYNWILLGDYVQVWPIPAKEREMNPSLTQNPGWMD